MTKILACVDGSGYADNICAQAAWAAKRMNADINVLHVLRRHSDYEAPGSDHTGSIGLGARSHLLERLTHVDEERGKLDQQKGVLILDHAKTVLLDAGIATVNTLHRRGALVETITELEKDADLIFIGKRGEHANTDSPYLGSNLEKTIRAVHKPLFVVSSVLRPIKRFLIAYDGKESVQKAIDYVTTSPLLKNIECHILTVPHHDKDIDPSSAVDQLKQAGFNPTIHTKISSNAGGVIASHVVDHDIDLLVTGAYSHSRIHSALLGSTTASLIKQCKIPLLLFR